MPPPLAPPRDLTIPDDGSTTARDVLSRSIGRLLGELAGLGRHAPRDAAGRADVAAFLAVLREALAAGPGAVASVVRRPTVGTLLRCLRAEAEPARAAALVAEIVAVVLFDLALAGALPRPVRLARFPRRILSLPGRLALALPDDAVALRLEPARVVVERASAAACALELALLRADPDAAARAAAPLAIERPYHPIERELVLALADNDPLAMVEAHPDKEGNAVDLGGRAPAEWVTSLRGALALVERHLPALRAEIDLFIHQLVPVGWDAERHLSASYQEAVGTIYLTLHPSPMTMTEAVIHEFSHNKLNALFDLDPVIGNPRDAVYASPVRPDPRPLHGVLLAVHAFQPIARLYERMLDAGAPEAASAAFRDRYARVRELNHEAAELVLAHGQPTAVGRGLLDEIRRWDEHYAAVR
jgi:HEXXH motif-containing protein